jgi:hypothetical protein
MEEEKIREIQFEQTKHEWKSHLMFLYRHIEQAKIAKEPVYLSEMENALKNSKEWFRKIFGEKELVKAIKSAIKQRINIIV